MSETAYRESLRLLQHLSSEELGKLREAIAALGTLHQAGGAPPATNAPMGNDIAGLVADVLEAQGFGRMSIGQLQKAAPRYSEVSAQLWTFARQAMPDGRRVEHLAILRLGVRMLIKNIEAQGIPVSHAVLMRQLPRLPAVVTQGFPGWARNGLLGVVLRRPINGQ